MERKHIEDELKKGREAQLKMAFDSAQLNTDVARLEGILAYMDELEKKKDEPEASSKG